MWILPPLPYIPLEVAENIIDQLSGDTRSLRSCALTCRGWNRHARYHLMASICVRSKEDLYSICDYITSNRRMASFVRSLSILQSTHDISLLEVLPVHLLKLLPNLQRYGFTGDIGHRLPDLFFHPTMLICMKTYLHVEELELENLRFHKSAELARVLTALPHLRRLKCRRVGIRNIAAVTTQFRHKCRRLSEVTIVEGPGVGYLSPADIIVQVSLSTLNVLRYDFGFVFINPRHLIIPGGGIMAPPDFSALKHLHFLELSCPEWYIDGIFDQLIPIVTTLPPNTLRSLTIISEVVPYKAWQKITRRVGSHPLEDTILALGVPSVVVILERVKYHNGTLAFWSKQIHSLFPRLSDGKTLQVQTSDGEPLGHGANASAIAISPDGCYLATLPSRAVGLFTEDILRTYRFAKLPLPLPPRRGKRT